MKGSTGSTKVFRSAAADNEGDFAAQDWLLFCGIALIWGGQIMDFYSRSGGFG